VEESLRTVTVPKLILQPLVENAIEHGFTRHTEGSVKILAETDGDEIYIIVMDNGGGFEADRLRALNAMLTDGNSFSVIGSIGLLNVHQRIQSVYGKACGVSILSEPGMSTSVTPNEYRAERSTAS